MIKRAVYFLAFFLYFACSQAYASSNPRLVVFHSPSCHECIQAKKDILPEMEREFKGRVEFEYRDITDIENYKYMLSLKEKYRPDLELALPVFFFQGNFLNGKQDIKNSLRQFILAHMQQPYREEKAGRIDLENFFKQFKMAGIIAAGLEDGFNPCAFTVIVFFISFLALQGYKKKELIVIGSVFIFTVFLTYLLIGLGIFNFLYRMQGFWMVSRTINLSIGVFSVILGFLALYDFFKFRRTKDTEGLVLQLPKTIKNRIHKIIGSHYRKAKEGPQQKTQLSKLIVSAFITAFLVSLLEAVCTGQLYLPTITFIFKTTSYKLEAFGYLLLYNFLFILPLFGVFLLAMFGVTSGQFAGFMKKHMGLIKILMAVMFFILGLFLIWRA